MLAHCVKKYIITKDRKNREKIYFIF